MTLLPALLLTAGLCACGSPAGTAPAPDGKESEPPASSALPADAVEPNCFPGMEGTLQEYAEANGAAAEILPELAGERDPFIPEGMNKAIIGSDNRITVTNLREYPYCAIGLMNVHATCGCSWQGSGFMVSPSGFLTAAHCMCCTEHRAFPDRLDIYFGYESDTNYYYKFDKGCTFWVGTTFDGGYTNENMEWDYAYIKLSERVGDYTGSFGIVIPGDDSLNDAYLEVAGYRDSLLKYDFGTAAVIGDRLFTLDADAVAGNSGGPIFFGSGQYEDYAAGIFVADNVDQKKNYCRRITGSVLQGMIDNGVVEQPS